MALYPVTKWPLKPKGHVEKQKEKVISHTSLSEHSHLSDTCVVAFLFYIMDDYNYGLYEFIQVFIFYPI